MRKACCCLGRNIFAWKCESVWEVTVKARLHEPKSSSQWREGDPSLDVAGVVGLVDMAM
jgi:hypothetical protein